MAISYVGNGGLVANATLATVSLVAPTLLGNDIMIAFAAHKAVSNAISAPDGTWTQIHQSQDGTFSTISAWWKLAALGDSGQPFVFSKATDDNILFGGVIAAWRGVHLTVPIDPTTPAVSHNASGDNVTFPAYDPTATDVEVIYFAFYRDDATTFTTTPPAGTNPTMVVRFDVESGLGSDASWAACSGANDGANVASRTWASASAIDGRSSGLVFALQVPAAGGGFQPAWARNSNMIIGVQ